MSDQGGVYLSDDQDFDDIWQMGSSYIYSYDFPVVSDQQNVWHQNAPPSSSFCVDDVLDDLSRSEIPSFQLQDVNLGDIPCVEDIIFGISEKGQSSDTKSKHASEFLEMQTKERDFQEDGVKEDSDTSDQSKQQKRTRSAEEHNQIERIRRQKLKEKMKTLQELIPNCDKGDKTSILDAAIKYIKKLQYQVRMMSVRANYSTFQPPNMMMAQPMQQGIQIPTLAAFQQAGSPVDGSHEMKYGIGMGMPGMFSPLDFPMSQVGSPNPCFLPLPATSRLPAPGGIQNPETLSEPLNSTSSSRVLPSEGVLPHLSKGVMDGGSSHSASSDWSTDSTAN